MTSHRRVTGRREAIGTLASSLAGVILAACSSEDGDSTPDVCIVGSGPAGAILALTLARRGIRTLLIEGGAAPVTRVPPIPVDRSHSVHERAFLEYPVDLTRHLGEGGTSNLWAGESPRMQPVDFAPGNAYSPGDNPWPISYWDIEPYYSRAERELAVAGGTEGPDAPPRRTAYPLSLPDPPADDCVGQLVRRADGTEIVTPSSTTPRVAETHVARLEEYRNCRILKNTRVTGVRLTRTGRVGALELRSLDGRTLEVAARIVVLACGGVENPRLLLASRGPGYPAGIGNTYDQVGRYFMEHLSLSVGTLQLESPLRCTASRINRISWRVYHELKSSGFGGAILEFGMGPRAGSLSISAVLEMRPLSDNRVWLDSATDEWGFPLARVLVRVSDDERRTLDALNRLVRQLFAGLPGDVVLSDGSFRWCHHHLGTCRMGTTPSTSVVDRNLRVHGVPNLYVAGSASFVTGGVGGPTLLLSALTLRLADHVSTILRNT